MVSNSYWSFYLICFQWIWCRNFQILASVLGLILENSWVIICVQYYPCISRKCLLLVNKSPLEIIIKLQISVIIFPINIIILWIRRPSIFKTQSDIILGIIVNISLIIWIKSNTILIQSCIITHTISYCNLWTIPILNIL